MDKFDIVLQGKYDTDTDEIISEYLTLPFVNNIIVSCWEDNKPFAHYGTNIKQVTSKYPASPGTDNRNLQIVSSLAGLQHTTTPFVAKMRSDQHYDRNSMITMYNYLRSNYKANNIFVAGTYPNLLFHPRDHIFWGERSNVLSLFEIPLEVNGIAERYNLTKNLLHLHYHEFMRSETYIGAHYLAKFAPEIKKYLEEPEKYLYDRAPEWNVAKITSDRITHQYFRPFPRKNIDMKWKRKGWNIYPYDDQRKIYGEYWSEDFVDVNLKSLNEMLVFYAKDPENDQINYTLGLLYDSLEQTAAAISYFLRAAERTNNKNLAYECLLKIGLCFERQGKRGNTVRGAYDRALCLMPKRPEAYFLISRFYERTGDHVNGYMFAELGLTFADENQIPLRSNVEYPGRYGLIFEKAVCSWWWGKPDECRQLLQTLKNEYIMDDIHRVAVERNIRQTQKQ